MARIAINMSIARGHSRPKRLAVDGEFLTQNTAASGGKTEGLGTMAVILNPFWSYILKACYAMEQMWYRVLKSVSLALSKN